MCPHFSDATSTKIFKGTKYVFNDSVFVFSHNLSNKHLVWHTRFWYSLHRKNVLMHIPTVCSHKHTLIKFNIVYKNHVRLFFLLFQKAYKCTLYLWNPVKSFLVILNFINLLFLTFSESKKMQVGSVLT